MRKIYIGLTFWFLIFSTAIDAGVREATVLIGGCSGVCVSEDGIVLTAKHCRHSDRVEVRFPHGSFWATKIYTAPGLEGPVAFDCDGDGFPFLDVADSPPRIGDRVTAAGYPSGRYIQSYGVVTQTQGLIWATVSADLGQSGGPLLDESDEVIGLLSVKDEAIGPGNGGFIPHGEILTAMETVSASSSEKPELVIFTQDGCAACVRLKSDAAELSKRYKLTFVKADKGQWSDPQTAREFATATGVQKIKGLPTIWIRGTSNYTVGYTNRGGLIQWISGILKGAVELIIGRSDPTEPDSIGPPVPDLGGDAPFDKPRDDPVEPVPQIEPEAEFEGVTIVLTVPAKLEGIKGTIAGLVAPTATGIVERMISERTDGQARVVSIMERLHPEEHFEFCEVLGIDENRITLTAFIPEQSLGLVKGLVAKKIENEIMPRIEGTVFNPIFERISPEQYTAGLVVLDRPRGKLEQVDSLEDTLKATIAETIKSHLLEKVQAKVETVSQVREAWRDGGIGGVLALLLGSFARQWHVGRKLQASLSGGEPS